jgi:hypothetical protein
MPLGGIGTGNVAICGDGALRQWQLHNLGNHRGELPFSFFALRATQWEPPLDVVRVLQAPPAPSEQTRTPLVDDDRPIRRIQHLRSVAPVTSHHHRAEREQPYEPDEKEDGSEQDEPENDGLRIRAVAPDVAFAGSGGITCGLAAAVSRVAVSAGRCGPRASVYGAVRLGPWPMASTREIVAAEGPTSQSLGEVVRGRIELPTPRFSVVCSTN